MGTLTGSARLFAVFLLFGLFGAEPALADGIFAGALADGFQAQVWGVQKVM